MRKIKRYLIFLMTGFMMSCSLLYYESYEQKKIADEIVDRITEISKRVKETGKDESIELNQIIKIKWDKIYIFPPYSFCTEDEINKILGFEWKKAKYWHYGCSDESVLTVLVVSNTSVIPLVIKRRIVDSRRMDYVYSADGLICKFHFKEEEWNNEKWKEVYFTINKKS